MVNLLMNGRSKTTFQPISFYASPACDTVPKSHLKKTARKSKKNLMTLWLQWNYYTMRLQSISNMNK